jgi:hypothetical protein
VYAGGQPSINAATHLSDAPGAVYGKGTPKYQEGFATADREYIVNMKLTSIPIWCSGKMINYDPENCEILKSIAKDAVHCLLL